MQQKMEKEKLLEKYPLPITINGTKTILEQMEKYICRIENKNGNGTGFFCKIPCGNEEIKVMITNNHVINEEILKNAKKIKVTLNDNKIKKSILLKDKKIYTSIKYDTTIIEINPAKDKIDDYLELDEDIFDEDFNIFNKSVYILQYPLYQDEQKAAVSFGILNTIENDYNINHYCSTDYGSSGSPIMKLSNKKVIGIHKEGAIKFNYNKGTFLKYPIIEFLNEIKNDKKKCIIKKKHYEMTLRYSISEEVKKLKKLKIFGTEFVKNNKNNIKMITLGMEYELRDEINDAFWIGVDNEIEIKIVQISPIISMKNMFNGCSSLLEIIDLSKWNIDNVEDMSFMFYGCTSLVRIPDISSWNSSK
jgi:surface protein